MKIKAIKKEDVCAISKELVDMLVDLLKCPRDYFVLEMVGSQFIMDGQDVAGLPMVEVYWFDRGQEIRDAYAKILTDKVREMGYEQLDIYFFNLAKENYYENGIHF